MSDLKEFLEGYQNFYLERFTLLEGLREGIARVDNNPLPIRVLLFLLFALDQALFRLLPVTRNYTSEYVMVLEKPIDTSA